MKNFSQAIWLPPQVCYPQGSSSSHKEQVTPEDKSTEPNGEDGLHSQSYVHAAYQ
eukprot:CAMPEP_0198732554 /NCGR_PEP_ID=MMETSP1475-20131203/36587_1 /TAXON_ID= ORGANISM="Unidentified sp., Strain CCMP1999" /NCGR_SAMPLE_ID=MMETSP1475 /ASSEMBLY_ACC=CAM_ASM_001111 /LENGTH=54 /DNA_ID=CAMNT_0044495691 /DNA_START=333 /DNA_END=497 /DNA_ORIENTATION=+